MQIHGDVPFNTQNSHFRAKNKWSNKETVFYEERPEKGSDTSEINEHIMNTVQKIPLWASWTPLYSDVVSTVQSLSDNGTDTTGRQRSTAWEPPNKRAVDYRRAAE